MQKQHKIAVLGPVPYNHITITWQDKVYEKYSAIIDPVIILSKLLGKTAHIVPVTHVRKKDEQTIKTLLRDYPGVELRYINADTDQGDVIRTRIVDVEKSLEKQYGFMNPITPRDVRELLESDAFVFVPLTDFEIALETLEFLKSYSKGLIIFDAHGPTTTMTSLGDRVAKFWVDRDLWLPYIDVLVMNLEEAKCSWFQYEYTLEQLEDRDPLDQNELGSLANHCLRCGVKAFYVTLGADGCLVYYLQNGRLCKEHVPAAPKENIVATIGCGEAFIGGLTYGILQTRDYVKAARFANIAAAQRCTGLTYDVYKTLDSLLT